MIDILVLAGGESFLTNGTKWKSMIPINSKPMINYVLSELKSLKNLGKIILIADEEVALEVKGFYDILVDSQKTIYENLLKGIEVASTKHVLVVSADIPLIKKEHLQWFIDQALKEDVAAVMPYITKLEMDKAYPRAKRTYVQLREGLITLGNLALIKKDITGEIKNLLIQVTKHRKNPLKIAMIVGLDILILYFMRLLSIRYIEKKALILIKHPVKGLQSPYPEIGMDVDKIEDLEMVKQYI